MKYDYLVVEERISPFGYRLVPKKLPHYLSIEIVSVDTPIQEGAVQYSSGISKQAYVLSSIHLNKRSKVGPSYGAAWGDQEILRDIAGMVAQRWM